MPYVTDDRIFEQYIMEVRGLWHADAATDVDIARRTRACMERWLGNTSTDARWLKDLLEDKCPGKALYTDSEHGFIQMGHYHHGHRENTPHDHGPYWVVYGVYQGETEIPVYAYDEDEDAIRVTDRQILKAGNAVAYLPGQIHSTHVPTDGPAIVLRFLSHDLGDVKRKRFSYDQLTGSR